MLNPGGLLLRTLLSGLLLSLLSGCVLQSAAPSSRSAEVPDPYRWLESPVSSASVSAWLAQQAQLTRDWQQQQPSYARIRAQLLAAWDHPKWMVASIQRDQVFFYYNPGLNEHYSLYMQPYNDFIDDRAGGVPPAGSARLLMDGSEHTEGASPGAISISPDAAWLAYQVNRRTAAGNWQTLWYLQSLREPLGSPQLVSVSDAGWTLPAEQLAWGRHAQRLFFTVSVPRGVSGWQSRVYALGLKQASAAPQQLHAAAFGESVRQLHVLDGEFEPGGEGRAGQVLLLATGSAAGDGLRWCLLSTEPATDVDAHQTECLALLPDLQTERYIGEILDTPAFITLGERGTGAVTLADAGQRRELIAETDAPLRSAHVVGQTLVMEYLVHGSSTLQFADLQGRAIELNMAPSMPAPVDIEALRATDGHKLLMSYSGILTPPRSVLLDVQSGQQTVLTRDRPDLDFDGLQTRLELVRSGEVRVPVWIAGAGIGHGRAPERMLLDVYGGFAAPMDTSFSISRLAWLADGGGYAVAGPRGGGDYGEHWHQAGRGDARHNSIADVIGVADWLRRRQSADQGSLAISGRSHGGLLATEAVHGAPGLFAALVTEAAVFDLMRLDALGAAPSWHQEYRGATSSPYQRLLTDGRTQRDHPPALLITRDNDEVVSPAHSFKYVQALQARSSRAPFAALLAVTPGQQHQASGDIDQLIDDYALRWAFLNSHLVMGALPE